MLIYGLLINFVYTVCRIFISYIRFAVYNNTEKRPTGSLGSQGMNPRMNPRLGSETLQQPVPVNVNKISLQLPVRIMRILGSMGVYDPQVQGMNPSLKNLPVESTGGDHGIPDPRESGIPGQQGNPKPKGSQASNW